MNFFTLKSVFLIATTLFLIGCTTNSPDYSGANSPLYQLYTKDIHRDLYQKPAPTAYDLLTTHYPDWKKEMMKKAKK